MILKLLSIRYHYFFNCGETKKLFYYRLWVIKILP